jgi:uncharacterized RDD family membrane protein YckC
MPAPQVPSSPEDFPATGPHALATFGQRTVARMLDLVIVSLPVAIVAISYLEVDGDQVSLGDIPAWLLMLQVTLAIGYEVVLLGIWGRTVGKWVFGIRVASYADGKKPGWGQSGQRVLLPGVFSAVPLPFVSALQWVVYGSSGLHPLRRGWHDRYAGTIVVRTR